MKRTIELIRILETAAIVATLASAGSIANAQQQPVVGHATSSSVQATPRSAGSPYASAAMAQTGMKAAAGAIAGYVYWDMANAHYKPATPCQGLTLSVSSMASPHAGGGQVLTTTNSFTPVGPLQDQTTFGIPTYMLCEYSLQKIPTGIYLRVSLAVQPSTFFPSVRIQSPQAFEIFGGNCASNGPQGALSYILTGGELVCGNNAFNINFQLSGSPLASRASSIGTNRILPSAAGRSGMLLSRTQAAGSGTTAPNALGGTLLPSRGNGAGGTGQSASTPGSTRMLLPAVQSGGAPTPGSSGGFTGGVKTGGNSAFTGGLRKGATPSFTGGVKPALLPAIAGGAKLVSGKRVRTALAVNSSIIAVFRQQKQGALSPAHTLASSSLPAIMAKQPNIGVQPVSQYVSSNLLTPQQNAWCKQWEAQAGAPVIFAVAGKTHGQDVVYSPDPQANPYTIIGCGFGSSGSAVLELGEDWVQKPPYTLPFTVQSWSDHQIVLSLDPNVSQIPDWNGSGQPTILRIKSARGTDAAGPGQFYARRQPVLLSIVTQNEASLYQQGSPYFMSPVANYYGLNGTVGVMRQGLPQNAVAAQDKFNLQLAPGFAIESTETDLLVANTSANVTSQPASVNGNTITVTYPVFSTGSGNSTNYYSIYGLKVWVTGPAGVPPIMPAP